MQTKTRQPLQLPLTDEAANVLIDYLKKARPQSVHRQLFFRMRAPVIPLRPASVNDVLEHRIRCSGLKLPVFSTHVLRHSLATRLIRQGVGIKAIGDTLGHRDVESTSIYLRLDLEDLREAALPLPRTSSDPAIRLVAVHSLPPIRPARPALNLPSDFQSCFSSSLRLFLELKRTFGAHLQG